MINNIKRTFISLFLLGGSCLLYSQMPSAIKITPENATGFQEITLTFYPDSACTFYGEQGLAGLDSIAMHSNALLVNEYPTSWNHMVQYNDIGFDGTLPHLYANPDGSYSMTFTPSKFYGTANTPIVAILAVFNDGFGWDKTGREFGESDCRDFYIPLNTEKTSVTLNVNMTHQMFLGNFDPLFDFVDVAGNFNNWGDPVTNLNDPNSDGIYTLTIPDLIIGQRIEYKFRINNDWATSEFPYWGANRVYVVQPGENILEYWYDNALPIKKTVTLIVNMNYQQEIGMFDPVEDTVDVAGTFNNWGSSITRLSDPDGDLIYSVQISDIYVGQTIQYKFRLDGSWDIGRHELPGAENNRFYTVVADTNVVYHWYNNENPELMPDLFFSEYLDGSGSNNAITITNRTDHPIDLYQYGIIYTYDGGVLSGPLKVSGPAMLDSHDSWLIVNPSFNLSAIDASAVDATISAITNFNGNDALALVKIYASGTKYRIVDRIGILSVNPGTGWDVAGIANATKDKRLVRKTSVTKGQVDWIKSAGTNPFNSEWIVLNPDIPPDLGSFIPVDNLDNQWHPQSSGTNVSLRSIIVNNTGEGIAVGDNGTKAITLNNGQNWSTGSYGNNQLYDVFFLPEKHGWIVGTNGTIFHTTDGLIWQQQNSGIFSWLESVFFLDTLNGYAAGEYAILHTTDGGVTWDRQSPDEVSWFNNIFFTDMENGWAIAWNMVLHTANGGQTWEKIDMDPDFHFFNVFFSDRLNGWLTGHEGLLMKTTDGGSSWTRIFIQMDGTIRDAYFMGPNVGWVVGDNGKIFFTNDGGINWKQQYSGTSSTLNDIFFISRNKGWIAGDNGTILSTLDGWNNQLAPSTSMLHSVFFTDERTGWTVGEQGTIIKTIDAGQTWDTIKKIHLTPTEPHYDIFFTDKKNGWVASSGGNIYHTNDGGVSWSVQPTGVGDWFQSVFFLDNNYGWTVAGGGKIAWTNNGGINWNPITYGNKLYNDVYFIDQTTGWLCGEQGIILKTTNGGLNWNPQVTPGAAFLTAIYFSDGNNGIAVGTDGCILKTINGGATWTQIPSVNSSSLFGLYFLDPLNGWACGDNGTIIYTYDGGNSWHALPSVTDKSLRDIFFTDMYHGWAVGADGIIIQTSSGGCSDPFVDLPRYERICSGGSIELDAGESPAYLWSTGSDERTVTVSTEGYYGVTVRNSCNQPSSDSVYLMVTDLPEFLFEPDGPTTFCDSKSVGVSVKLLNNDGTSDYAYDWKGNIKDSATVRIDTAGFFPVTVTDRFGCRQKDSIEITVQYPFNNEKIGVVTYDATVGKNLVVWEKTPDKGTQYYNIYKVLPDTNLLLGSVDYNDLTVYTDVTSNPRKESDRYVITVVDTCSNESFYSASHKTMHLSANKGTSNEVNLIWEHYEGIQINYYYIFRGTDSTAMSLIDSISYDISKTQYTDQDPPAGIIYYQIGVKLPEVIILSPGKKADSGPYSHSMSNIEDNRFQTGIKELSSSGDLAIYPNPSSGQTTVSFPNPEQKKFQLVVRDLSGKIVLAVANIVDDKVNFERGSLKPGFYSIEVVGNKIYQGKLVIE
jgi:photosystem II stability/assembly factor-like uncharacterized protein